MLSNMNGKLFNVHSSQDRFLKKVCRLVMLGQYPCGVNPIAHKEQRIENVDVSSLIRESHSLEGYLETLSIWLN